MISLLRPNRSRARRFRLLLFVYGSLRCGAGTAAGRRLAAQGRWLARGRMAGRLVRQRGFPMLWPLVAGRSRPHCRRGCGLTRRSISGDLFLLRNPATLRWLDRYEGDDYRRVEVSVRAGGRWLPAQCYLAADRGGAIGAGAISAGRETC